MILVTVSTGHFDALIRECSRLYPKYDFFGQIGSSLVKPPFPHAKVLPPGEIEDLMKRAELVISHGGAGMTAMIHRLKKPSVIVPKQLRYGEPNDLQVELARKWGDVGMGVLCMDVENLDQAIQECRARAFHFPEYKKLGVHLREVLHLQEEGGLKKLELAGY